jgi:hypothetical protein
MGDVVAFSTSASRARRAASPDAGGAQILFFLGVRYQRMEEPPRAASGGSQTTGDGGAKKRKPRARA